LYFNLKTFIMKNIKGIVIGILVIIAPAAMMWSVR